MQTERTFIDDLKHQYKYGGMTIRLIFINVAIFLLVRIIDVFVSLGGATQGTFIHEFANPVLALQTNFSDFITHPWGIFTSIFTHYGVMHLLWNMIFLYFAGRLFEQIWDQKRLLYIYLVGGVFGSLLEVAAHGLLPKLGMFNDVVVGASGSIMAVFTAIAFYRPQMTVNLFGIIPVRVIILAVIFILRDLLNLGNGDGVAHFAHLGGAIIGMASIQSIHSSNNLINRAQQLGDWLQEIFSRKRGPRMRVKKSKKDTRVPKSDEDYNMEAKQRQERIDQILDKISKSGYDSLTKKEKDFLFNQSKK